MTHTLMESAGTGRSWDRQMSRLIRMAQMLDASAFGRSWSKADSMPAFHRHDGLPRDTMEEAQETATLSTAGALSLETKIRRVHPEWSDEQVAAEIERILPMPSSRWATASAGQHRPTTPGEACSTRPAASHQPQADQEAEDVSTVPTTVTPSRQNAGPTIYRRDELLKGRNGGRQQRAGEADDLDGREGHPEDYDIDGDLHRGARKAPTPGSWSRRHAGQDRPDSPARGHGPTGQGPSARRTAHTKKGMTDGDGGDDGGARSALIRERGARSDQARAEASSRRSEA
jgi:hypothetical protein